MKLKRIKFDENGFRKLKNFDVDFAKYITIIAGHNGIGKSTILGLIANASGLTLKKEGTSLFERTFQADFSDLFFIDYHKDYADYYDFGDVKSSKTTQAEGKKIIKRQRPKELSPPPGARIFYSYKDDELEKHCKISAGHTMLVDQERLKNNRFLIAVPQDSIPEKDRNAISQKPNLVSVFRPRIIARTPQSDKNIAAIHGIKESGKIPIPTIYLGMSRMMPIGEFNQADITIKNRNDEYTDYIKNLYSIIFPPLPQQINIAISETDTPSQNSIALNQGATLHSFSNSNKKALVPNSEHSTLAVSLGQDSVASIFTALASFKKLKDSDKDNYSGGLLVIDEIDAGLHPNAQHNLMTLLFDEAKKLQLQIVATSHSLTVIKTVFNLNDGCDYSKVKNPNNLPNSVFYLQDTNRPKPLENTTYTAIKNDMLMTPYRRNESKKERSIKLYFEDNEAFDLFRGIIEFKNISSYTEFFGHDLLPIPVILGCSNLLKLAQADNDFRQAIFILDADTEKSDKGKSALGHQFPKNVMTLPSSDQLPPDQLIFSYLQQKLNDISSAFWDNNDLTTNYVSELMIRPVLAEFIKFETKDRRRDIFKRFYNSHRERIQDSHLFTQWAKENANQCEEFIADLARKVDTIAQASK